MCIVVQVENYDTRICLNWCTAFGCYYPNITAIVLSKRVTTEMNLQSRTERQIRIPCLKNFNMLQLSFVKREIGL